MVKEPPNHLAALFISLSIRLFGYSAKNKGNLRVQINTRLLFCKIVLEQINDPKSVSHCKHRCQTHTIYRFALTIAKRRGTDSMPGG